MSGGLERRIVSILFCDLVDFTPLSERYDPEDIATIQDRYFASVRDAVGRYGGTIGKFIGDAAMAVFGTPRAREDDAERAVRAALAVARAIDQVAAGLDLPDGELKLRVGVNTGEVATDPTQASAEMLVTGDAVNVAARLQTAAPHGGVLIGPETALAVEAIFELRDAGPLELKGKREPVHAYEVVAAHASPSRDHAMGSLRAPLLGREREIALLKAAADAVGGGTPRSMAIVAPPGVGKSRLIREFIQTAALPALATRCRLDAAGPFEPIAELLRAASNREGVTSPEAGLASMGIDGARGAIAAREIHDLIDPDQADLTRPTERREVRFDAWRDGLCGMLGGPAIVVVEDLHRASTDTIEFLAHLTATATRPLLVVTSARPSALDRLETAGLAGSSLHELAPLTDDATRLLVSTLIGDALPDALLDSIAARSDGNALFVEELLRTWVATGVLERSDDAWRLTVAPEEAPLPSTVQALYAAQLDDLPASAREAARHASVSGRRFPAGALRPLGVADPEGGTAVLARRGMIGGPDPDDLVGDTFTYRHAMVREAAYASLARRERARLHVTLARWIEETAAGRADEIADVIASHYASALDSLPQVAIRDGSREILAETGASWFERAGTYARRVAATAAAVEHLRHAVRLTDPTREIDLARRLTLLGEVLRSAGRLDEALDALERSWTTGKRLDLDDRASLAVFGEAATSLCLAQTAGTGFPRSRDIAAEAIELLGGRDEMLDASLRVHRDVAIMGLTNQWGTLIESAERLAAIAAERDAPAMELIARKVLTPAGLGDLERDMLRVEDLARRIGDWDSVAQSMRDRGMRAFETMEDGRDLVRAARDVASSHGLTDMVGWCDHGRAEIAFHLGDWDEAVDLCRSTLGTAVAGSYHRLVYRVALIAMPMAIERAETELLQMLAAWLERARSSFPDPPSPYGLASTAGLDEHLARWSGSRVELPPAQDLAESFSLVSSQPSWAATLEILFDRFLRDGDKQAATRALERVSEISPHVQPRASTFGLARLLRARLARATGAGPDDVRADAAAAVEAFRTVEAPWWEAKAIRLLEEIDEASVGDRARARLITTRLRITR